MFTLQNASVADGDLCNAREFVAFWSQFNRENTEIDYLDELRIGQNLTEDNCRRLLRWKDRRLLTDTILTGPNRGQNNPRVGRVLTIRRQINLFRSNQLTEDAFGNHTSRVFPNGLIWQVFLFHIAKPHLYPIADQHVFRVFRLHSGEEQSGTWDFYLQYRVYFGRIARQCGIALRPQNVRGLKQIDDAIMVFGKFLKAYYRG